MKTQTTILDFDNIDYSDRAEIAELIYAWNENLLPDDFITEGGKIIERNSVILLINSHNQTLKMNGIDAEYWYLDPETGEEGYREDFSPEALERMGLK